MRISSFFFVVAALSSFTGCTVPVDSAGGPPEIVDTTAEVAAAAEGEVNLDGSPTRATEAVTSAPGSKDNPFVLQKRLLNVDERKEQHATLGRCSTVTLESELSAPGLEPFIAVETFTSCDRPLAGHGSADSGYTTASANVNQYAPAPSYTCVRGQGLQSKWKGGGTIQTQYVSFERGGSFYVGYGSGIGLTMASTFYWSMQMASTDRIYAATMRTSDTLSGAGTCCFNAGSTCSI